jgi:hypothetical protein
MIKECLLDTKYSMRHRRVMENSYKAFRRAIQTEDGSLMLPWTAQTRLDRIGREALYEPGETDD